MPRTLKAKIHRAKTGKKLYYFTIHAKNGELTATGELRSPNIKAIKRTLANNFPNHIVIDETVNYVRGKKSNIIISNYGDECGA